MKKKRTFRYCEFCNNPIEDVSPPPKDQYEMGRIEIKEGTVLLPDKIVQKNYKEGFSDGHSQEFNGVYCNLECLYKQIENILKI